MARPSQLQKLGSYLRPHWRTTLAGILALLVVNAIGIYIPLQIKNAIDTLGITFSFDQILFYVMVILVAATVMLVVRMASRVLLFGVGRQVEFDLKQRIFTHLLRQEPAYFGANAVGDLISRATSDVENIRRLVGFAVLSLANTLFAYALTLPAMLLIDVRLSLLALSVYPFMLVLVNLFSHRLRSQQLQVQEKLSGLSELIQEDMSGIALIKIYAQEENERRAFADSNRGLLKANLKLALTRNTLFPILTALGYGSALILLWFGSGAIERGEITIGSFIALLIFVERLAFPTALLGFTITAYQRGEVSIDRIEAILSVEPEIQTAPDAIPLAIEQVKGGLVAQNLTFSYPKMKTPALNQVSFTISPGETIAIVGQIGSGKSTLANALPRLLNIAPGELFIDGYDITQLRLDDLRRAIAYVPQESFLFSTTIKNNIRYGKPLAEPDEVEYAAKTAQIHREILNFPQQYETIVGERGITLSGGQRQRTALARALLVDSPILILDDALSSVDNQTATQILKNLSEGTDRKTVVFISHQLSAAAMTDRIFVMEQGRVVQMGSHSELLAQAGLYRSLWEQNTLEEAVKE
ncbi:ABC transporter ATP-binding protein [Myxacorys almedinensis]|uniref:ATP-binding cassette domain-containing protein n=1 Tax=Myxacorys almedinensis A TaxID=2690445 RepID=A0A8J7Z4H3_9CYAN|nr:ABC transporter ATP-binding protein [Myxacorys almedinensis]NDJ17711.1 ATP-binding cassette domain-containing protein [Myxacorys almedinensis A]